MDETILIKMLQLHFQHERKLREFAGKINLGYFEIDLLSLVLDAVGVPADNTLEQIGKYGYGDWIGQPGIFSRALYYEEFQNQVTCGSEAECRAYLEYIIITSTFQHLLDGRKVEALWLDA